MGILTAKEILKQMDLGHIEISPFEISRLNPNSYNLRLADTLMIYNPVMTSDRLQENFKRTENAAKWSHSNINYAKPILDTREAYSTIEFTIGDSGYILEPGKLYLASTMEETWTDNCIPILSGRSSVGRLGISVHVTAGFGDIGFRGKWTLEIFALEQVIIHPGDEICQIYFESAVGDTSYQYNGRYQHQTGVVASRMNEEKKGIYKE